MFKWFDLVPQETLFWRASCYQDIGGMDPTFHFAMDWDLLLRFEEAGYRIARVPYFLGCFRTHPQQKTSAKIKTVGEEEMTRLRIRTHGRPLAPWQIMQHLIPEQQAADIIAWLSTLGIRW
jgi:GT2 family glycosyltransferase